MKLWSMGKFGFGWAKIFVRECTSMFRTYIIICWKHYLLFNCSDIPWKGDWLDIEMLGIVIIKNGRNMLKTIVVKFIQSLKHID